MLKTGSLTNIVTQCQVENMVQRTSSLPLTGQLSRSGSMPNIRMKDRLRQGPFYLVTITINKDPAKLIRDPNPDLKIHGFSVTLADLSLMYQVVDREKPWLSLSLIENTQILRTLTCFQCKYIYSTFMLVEGHINITHKLSI